MLALGELRRAAGTVLLSPIELPALGGTDSWRCAQLVGSADPAAIAAATADLRGVAPQIEVALAPRRGCDVICLLLTGERHTREKVAAVLSGAPPVLMRGRSGQWYRVRHFVWRPTSPRWWGRTILAGPLVLFYLLLVELALIGDLVSRVRRGRPPVTDPGPVGDARVTFIVPTYNQRALMDFCLPALLQEAGSEHEIVVVDDAGTDDTAGYVQQTYPAVRVIRLDQNQGFAGAARAGIATTRTPLFALINNDAQVRPGFLRAMLPHFTRPEVFAVCSRIELPEGSQVETGRVAAAFSGILEPHHLPPSEEPTPILYAGGASSIFHRARYEALGGFDRLYRPFYWEDIELGYRAWRAGWESWFEPKASVFHQRRATIGPRFGDAYAEQTFLKNGLLFVLKNVRDRRLMSRHLGYVAARVLLELPAGDRRMSGAVRRAMPLMLRALWKRWREPRRGDVSDREIIAQFEFPEGAPA